MKLRMALTFALLCWHTMTIAAITLHIDPPTAQPGETLRLTLTQDDPQFQSTPDLTPLKQDFTVVGTEHSMSYSAINGVAKSENNWIILLIPKKTGLLPIPPIRMGQQESPAGQVNITTHADVPASENQAESSDEDNPVALHAEIDQPAPFINQQIVYTVKLLTREPLLNAQYQAPSVDNALVIPLGDGRQYQTTLNGHEYSVDEQKYAIYPQKSGALHIHPPKLSAIIYDATPNRINVEANASKLMVKPIPKHYSNQPWLPAKQVSLTEQYDSSTSTMTEGSTLVRTITLRANGLPAELLPNLTFEDSEQFSVYPEKPETHNALRQQELIGTRTIKVTYILHKTGNITLPSIELSWFNTQTGQHEIATLPSHQMTITNPSHLNTTTPSLMSKQQHSIHSRQATPTPAPVNSQFQSIAWWVAGAFGMAWVLLMILWWRLKRRRVVTPLSIRQALKKVRHACETNNPALARATLLNWGRLQWPHVALLNLNELSALSDNILLKKQISLLSEALYSQKDHPVWNGKALWQAVTHYRPYSLKKKTKPIELPPMNPTNTSQGSK